MLQIKCDHCGTTLKGKDIAVTPFNNYADGVKYKDYAVTCTKCGSAVCWERYTQKANENKEKAIEKFALKKGISIAKTDEAKQYNAIMRKIGKQVPLNPDNFNAVIKDFNRNIAMLSQEEKQIILGFEDKEDMAILNKENHKPIKHISALSILLLTQSIIEVAIADKDEDFFQTNYGEVVVDAYNTALTLRTGHDYEITAELLLEKMRKGTIVLNTKDMRRGV